MRSLRCLASLFVLGVPLFAASVPGIENFDQVDGHVYRGAQPTDEGFRYLAQIGVKTVVDLRETGSRSKAEQKAVSDAGMRYISVPMSGLTPPTEAQMTSILSLLEDSSAGPVFVHCKRGADRTGTVIAAYHIEHDRWENDKALADAKAHHMSPFQIPRQRYITSFTSALLEQAQEATAPAVTRSSENTVALAQ